MENVTLTLSLSAAQAIAVLAVLQETSSEAHISTVDDYFGKREEVLDKVLKEREEPPIEEPEDTVVKTTAGKKTKMPGFGRTQEQIDEFTETEQERFDKRTEEDLEKEQRAEERKVKKAEKQLAIDEKKAIVKAEEKEVADIKAVADNDLDTVEMPKSPFAL